MLSRSSIKQLVDICMSVSDEAKLSHVEVARKTETIRDAQWVNALAAQSVAQIRWELNGHETCGYDNWLGTTPFGRILITWKGWKEFPQACVDEFPGSFQAYGHPDDVRRECEEEYKRRLYCMLGDLKETNNV